MKKIKKHKWKLLSIIIIGLLTLWGNYAHISHSSDEFIFDNSNNIPKSQYALFLGTPKYLPNGSVNNYYKNRISSAVKLYTKQKVNKIIISADSLNKYGENEIELIKADLIQKGVKESSLILDKNGNRTWKSITNLDLAKTDRITLVSQRFHLDRAIYIAKQRNINAIGFEAKGKMSTKLWIREVLARVKMRFDLLLN